MFTIKFKIISFWLQFSYFFFWHFNFYLTNPFCIKPNSSLLVYLLAVCCLSCANTSSWKHKSKIPSLKWLTPISVLRFHNLLLSHWLGVELQANYIGLSFTLLQKDSPIPIQNKIGTSVKCEGRVGPFVIKISEVQIAGSAA